MSKPAKLTLILANGTSEVLHQLQDSSVRAWFARAAGRGVLRRTDEDAPDAADHLNFEWHLLGAAGLQAHAKSFASACVCLAADPREGFWMRSEPMHFAAGMTRLDAVTLRGTASLTDDERARLETTIGDYIRSVGLQWEARGWLIGFANELAVQTRQPNLAVDLERAMPSGADSKELRRLMTELQMVLHEHPVNARRARIGLPAANAVWMWGGGLVKSLNSNYTTSIRIFGTDPFTSGLAVAVGSQAVAPQTPEQLLTDMNDRDAAAVLELNGDSTLLDRWLRPLQSALARARLRSLVIAIDQWTIELTRASKWRVWRSDVPIESWNAA
jgi:hypothetical protein